MTQISQDAMPLVLAIAFITITLIAYMFHTTSPEYLAQVRAQEEAKRVQAEARRQQAQVERERVAAEQARFEAALQQTLVTVEEEGTLEVVNSQEWTNVSYGYYSGTEYHSYHRGFDFLLTSPHMIQKELSKTTSRSNFVSDLKDWFKCPFAPVRVGSAFPVKLKVSFCEIEGQTLIYDYQFLSINGYAAASTFETKDIKNKIHEYVRAQIKKESGHVVLQTQKA